MTSACPIRWPPLAPCRAAAWSSCANARSRRTGAALRRAAENRANARTWCLIAGDPELASRLGADGLHLPEARAGEAAYWRARFPPLLITTSAHSLRALLRAQSLPVDAVFLSPVFATRSHPGRASLSPVRANLIARQCAFAGLCAWRNRCAQRSAAERIRRHRRDRCACGVIRPETADAGMRHPCRCAVRRCRTCRCRGRSAGAASRD